MLADKTPKINPCLHLHTETPFDNSLLLPLLHCFDASHVHIHICNVFMFVKNLSLENSQRILTWIHKSAQKFLKTSFFMGNLEEIYLIWNGVKLKVLWMCIQGTCD